jgi:hypothetical protein
VKQQRSRILVFLAITPRGLKDALRQAEGTDAQVWCGAEAMSEEDFETFTGTGLTRFGHALDRLDLPDALGTIAEHHPGEVVWVEAVLAADVD